MVALATMFTGPTVRTGVLSGWLLKRLTGRNIPLSTVFILVPKPLAKATDSHHNEPHVYVGFPFRRLLPCWKLVVGELVHTLCG